MALKNKLGKVNLYILIKYTKGILGTRWKLQTGIRGSRGFFFFISVTQRFWEYGHLMV